MTEPVKVAIVDEETLAPEARLAEALERAEFWRALESAAHARGVSDDQLRIVVAPDLGAFARGAPTATDPRLVEELIDLLHGAGYTNAVVAAAPDSSALWAENRDVLALADLLGYRFATPAGRSYEIADLSEDLAAADFAPGEALHSSQLSAVWQQADFRVLFTKNKTDETHGFSLCLESVLGVLPLADKDYYYRGRLDPGDVVAELLRRTPVHFALIDAVASAHGSGGARAPRPADTHCIIASSDVRLADYVGALKMGLDPDASPLSARVRKALGMPAQYTIDGSLRPYAGWINAHPLVVDSTSRRDATPAWRRLLRPWLQSLDAELFPLKSPLDAKANASLAPLVQDVDGDPAAFAGLVFANYMLWGLQRGLDAYRVMYDKDAVRRVEVPLGIDLGKYCAADYHAAARELSSLEPLLEGAPPRAEGLRWRELEQAVLFEFERALPVDYDEFVDKVDVAKTIQYMNDYIGGVVVQVERDASGRVIRQAERNLYLPQPNYLVLADGKPIDVGKLELVEYSGDVRRMYWKTVVSENGSAVHDDGIVSFARGASGTRVRIFGRQQFVLPPFWQAARLDLNPELKAMLVTHAYKSFFDRTLANFEALLEGRDIRIGRDWHAPATPLDSEPMPSARLERALGGGAQWLKRAWEAGGAAPRSGDRPAPLRIDEDGFAHFQATEAERGSTTAERAADFWSGLAQAAARDSGLSAGTAAR